MIVFLLDVVAADSAESRVEGWEKLVNSKGASINRMP